MRSEGWPVEAVDAGGEAEVFQLATRVLTGVALRGLALSVGSMSLPQFRLLALVEESGRSTAAEAAAALRLAGSTVATLAARLVASGHLGYGQHPYNRGLRTFELTPRGREAVVRVRHWRHQELTRILDRLTPAERHAAAGAMRRFIVAAAGEGYGTDHISRDIYGGDRPAG